MIAAGRISAFRAAAGDWLRTLQGRSWLLVYALLVETALQFLLKTWSEALEVVLFVAILTAFLGIHLAAGGIVALARRFTATWTQRLALLFILGMMLSFLWGDHSARSLLALLRLPTYLVIIAMVVEGLREEGRLRSFAWTILGGVSLVFLLVFVEFYWGSDAVGLECADVERCVTRKMDGWHWAGLLRLGDKADDFGVAGGTLNASVLAEGYGISRLALFGLLAGAVGWGLMLTAGRYGRLLAGGLVILVIFGVIVSGSRSGALAALLVFAILAALTALTLPRQALPLLLAGAAVAVGVFALLQTLPYGKTAFDRLADKRLTAYERFFAGLLAEDAVRRERLPREQSSALTGVRRERETRTRLSSDERRIRNWGLAIDLFAANPAGGNGFRTFQGEAAAHFPGTITIGVHNGYLKVLSETGLLGTLPFLALLTFALGIMLRRRAGLTAGAIWWRNVFLSAFIAMLTINLVDNHSSDRYFWIVLAFAAGVESWQWQRAAPAGVRPAAPPPAGDKSARGVAAGRVAAAARAKS